MNLSLLPEAEVEFWEYAVYYEKQGEGTEHARYCARNVRGKKS
jgi:hypothetical protein